MFEWYLQNEVSRYVVHLGVLAIGLQQEWQYVKHPSLSTPAHLLAQLRGQKYTNLNISSSQENRYLQDLYAQRLYLGDVIKVPLED